MGTRTYKDAGAFELGIEMVMSCEDATKLECMRQVITSATRHDVPHLNLFKQATLVRMIDDKLLAMHET